MEPQNIETPVAVAILEEGDGTFGVYNANSLGGDIAIKAGAELAIGADGTSAIGAEDLIAANPDVLFMVWYNGFMGPEEVVASVMENPALANLTAVKTGRVYPLNLTSIYCSGIRTYEGITHIANALYPEMN